MVINAVQPVPSLQVHLYDGELEAARYCALEEASLDGSRLLAYLPGSILVNKEPLGTAFQSDICPNRITRSVLTAVYDLLQVNCWAVGGMGVRWQTLACAQCCASYSWILDWLWQGLELSTHVALIAALGPHPSYMANEAQGWEWQ